MRGKSRQKIPKWIDDFWNWLAEDQRARDIILGALAAEAVREVSDILKSLATLGVKKIQDAIDNLVKRNPPEFQFRALVTNILGDEQGDKADTISFLLSQHRVLDVIRLRDSGPIIFDKDHFRPARIEEMDALLRERRSDLVLWGWIDSPPGHSALPQIHVSSIYRPNKATRVDLNQEPYSKMPLELALKIIMPVVIIKILEDKQSIADLSPALRLRLAIKLKNYLTHAHKQTSAPDDPQNDLQYAYANFVRELGRYYNDESWLQEAESSYQRVLQEIGLPAGSRFYAVVQRDLGNTLLDLYFLNSNIEELNLAKTAYTKGLNVVDRKTGSLLYGSLALGVGRVLTAIGEAINDTAALENAVAYCRNVLSTLALEPQASVTSSLARAYYALGHALTSLGIMSQRQHFLEEAVAELQKAVSNTNKETGMELWGDLHALLGKAIYEMVRMLALNPDQSSKVNRRAFLGLLARKPPGETGPMPKAIVDLFRKAIEAFSEALEAYEKAEREDLIWQMEHNISTIYNLIWLGTGDSDALREAERYSQRAVVHARRSRRLGIKMPGNLDLKQTYTDLRHLRKAIKAAKNQ